MITSLLHRRAVRAASRFAQLSLVLGGFAAAIIGRAQTTITPVPVNSAYDSISGDYQMQVDDGAGGASVVVSVVHHYVTLSGVNTTNTYYGHFAFTGGAARVTVALTEFTGSSTFTPSLSPATSGIAVARLAGTNQVQFTIGKGQPSILMLNVTDSLNTYPDRLIIMADPAESDLYTVPPSSGAGIFNTTTYGSSDGYSADCSGAINNALTAAHNYYTSSGHVGIVYVPKVTAAGSVYKISDSIVPQTGTALYLPPGVIIRADTVYTDWPGYKAGDSPGAAVYMLSAPGNNDVSPYTYLENFTVFGRGTIDCKGVEAGGGNPYNSTKLRVAVANIQDSQDITFNGIVCRESTAITFNLDRNEGVHFIDTKVINYAQDSSFKQNDGMDMYQCQSSTANHCFIFTRDDAVALKGANTSSEPRQSINDVYYNDMVIWTGVNGLKFGNAEYAPVTNSYFSNSTVVSAEYGLSIEANLGTVATNFNNLAFYNINTEAASSKSFHIENSGDSDDGYATISDVHLIDCSVPSTVSVIDQSTSHGGSVGSVSLVDYAVNGTIATNNTTANVSTSGSPGAPTYTSDTNLISGKSPSSNSGNWASGVDGTTSLTDGNTVSQAETTNTSQGQVTYSLGATRTIDRVQVFQDYGSFDVQYWKVEYSTDNVTYTALFPPAVINFDTPTTVGAGFTTAGVSGWNTMGFPPVSAAYVRFTFLPSSPNKVGVNEITVFGH